ncbi:hypothetical protein UlMin_026323 [Ulmus minor]
MGKQTVLMKVMVYALSCFQLKVILGLWRDLPSNIHHKISHIWISATLLLYLEKKKLFVFMYPSKPPLSLNLFFSLKLCRI